MTDAPAKVTYPRVVPHVRCNIAKAARKSFGVHGHKLSKKFRQAHRGDFVLPPAVSEAIDG